LSALKASSGNLASSTSLSSESGSVIRQSGRVPLESVAWNE
jgi:hypothetical protein